MTVWHPWRGLAGLPAEVWMVFGTTLVNRLGMMALPFLAVYLAEHLEFPARIAGFAITVYGAGTLMVAPVAGRLSDRFGGLRVMQVSLLVAGTLLLFMPLARGPVQVFGLIFIWALAAEAVRPASLATLTGASRPDQRKAAVALNRLAINLGMSVGPAVGGFLAAVSFPLLFIVDGATSIAAGLFLAVMLKRHPLTTTLSRESRGGRVSSVLADRWMVAFLAGTLLFFLVFLQLDAALPLFLVRDLALPVSFFGAMFMLNTVMIILLEVPLNLAMAGWSYRTSLPLGVLLTATGFGALALASGPWHVVMLIVIWTFGEMIFLPGAASYVGDMAPDGQRGQYVGAYSMMFGVALMVGPWAGAWMLDHFGAVVLWTTTGASGAVAAAVVWWVTTVRNPATVPPAR